VSVRVRLAPRRARAVLRGLERVAANAVPAISTGVADELGGGFGGLVRQAGQHAGVGVGGEHDAGVPERRLHDLQVVAGRERQACRPVAHRSLPLLPVGPPVRPLLAPASRCSGLSARRTRADARHRSRLPARAAEGMRP